MTSRDGPPVAGWAVSSSYVLAPLLRREQGSSPSVLLAALDHLETQALLGGRAQDAGEDRGPGEGALDAAAAEGEGAVQSPGVHEQLGRVASDNEVEAHELLVAEVVGQHHARHARRDDDRLHRLRRLAGGEHVGVAALEREQLQGALGPGWAGGRAGGFWRMLVGRVHGEFSDDRLFTTEPCASRGAGVI